MIMQGDGLPGGHGLLDLWGAGMYLATALGSVRFLARSLGQDDALAYADGD
jgi:hypothetical protein